MLYVLLSTSKVVKTSLQLKGVSNSSTLSEMLSLWHLQRYYSVSDPVTDMGIEAGISSAQYSIIIFLHILPELSVCDISFSH